MKSFRCQACGNLLHFDNRRCLRCGSTLGFDPQVLSLEALAPGAAPGTFQASGRPDRVFRFCTNARFDVCNWLVPAGAGDAACRACRHNHLLPDIASPKGLERWRAICRAQRHLIYSLERLHLDPSKNPRIWSRSTDFEVPTRPTARRIAVFLRVMRRFCGLAYAGSALRPA